MSLVSADHRRFALWCAVVLLVSLPPWWLWGADAAAIALAPVTRGVMMLFGLKGLSVVDGDWLVRTGLLTDGGGELMFPVARDTVRRLLLGAPLFFAFMIAPPRAPRPWRAAVIGLAILTLVFALSVTAYVWGELAQLLNPGLAPAGQATAIRLVAAPLHPAAAQVALIGRYVSMSVLPLLTAVLLWAGLNPAGRKALAPPV